MLAENLIDPARGLFDPLINLQTAPIGFIVVLHGLISIAGYSERVLRLLPFLASLAAVPMVWFAAKRFAPRSVMAYAAGLAALSPLLIRYSNELKPYASDALFGAVAIWLALWAIEDLTWRRWLVVLTAGLGMVLCSVPGAFLFCGIALAVLLAREAAPLVERVRMVGTTLGVAVGLFAVLYFSFYSTADLDLQNIHFPFVGFGREFARSVRAFLSGVLVGPSAEAIMPPGTVGLLAVATLAGGIALIIRYRQSWLSIAAPLVALAAAYLVQRWPLTPRVLLWCLPSVILMTAVACDEIRRRLPSRLAAPARAVLPLLLLVPAGYEAVTTALSPSPREDTAGAVAALRLEGAGRPAGVDEPLYVAAHAEPTCRFYSPGVPDRWECEIPGFRPVIGDWMPVPTHPPAVRAWATGEGGLVAREMPEGGWLLLAGAATMREAILSAVEARGFRRVETRSFEGAALVRVERLEPTP